MRSLLLLLVLLAGCQTDRELRKVQPPQVVTKIIEVPLDLPLWATEQIVIPQPADGRVQELIDSNNARGEWLKYVNCRSKLIQKVEAGEKVNIKDCTQ